VVFDVARDLTQRVSRAGGGDTENVFARNLRVVNLGGAVTAITGLE
jgi:hypothetical protein